MNSRTTVESLLRRDRWLIGGALLVAIALCWAWIIPMARDMYGPMTGAGAWMMTVYTIAGVPVMDAFGSKGRLMKLDLSRAIAWGLEDVTCHYPTTI